MLFIYCDVKMLFIYCDVEPTHIE